jgi:hypothetical protein
VISSLTVLPSSLGDALIPMLPSGTLLLTILVLSYAASGFIPSSVVVLAYLSSFCSLLLMHMMLLLQNSCWQVQCASIRSVLVSSVWMRPDFSLRLIAWIHTVLGAVAGIPWNAKRQKNRSCLHPGPKKNWANAAALSTSLDVFFSFFISNVHLCVAGPRWPRR